MRKIIVIYISIYCLGIFSLSEAQEFMPKMPDSISSIINSSGLTPFLNSDRDIDRILGCIRLGQIGTVNDINKLYDVYQKEPIRPGFSFDLWPGVKYHALQAIGNIGGPEAESTLIIIANSMTGTPQTDSLQIIESLCDALSNIGTTLSKQVLWRYYEDKQFYEYARIYAIMGYWSIDLKTDAMKNITDSLNYLFSKLPETDSISPSNQENYILLTAFEYLILKPQFCNPDAIKLIKEKIGAITTLTKLHDRLQFISELIENKYKASQN